MNSAFILVSSDFSSWTEPGLCSKLTPTSVTSWDTRLCLPQLTWSSRAYWEGPQRRAQLASTGVRRPEWRLSVSVSMPTSTTTGSGGWRGCCRGPEWRRWQGKLWWISWSQLLSPSVPFILVSVFQSLSNLYCVYFTNQMKLCLGNDEMLVSVLLLFFSNILHKQRNWNFHVLWTDTTQAQYNSLTLLTLQVWAYWKRKRIHLKTGDRNSGHLTRYIDFNVLINTGQPFTCF